MLPLGKVSPGALGTRPSSLGASGGLVGPLGSDESVAQDSGPQCCPLQNWVEPHEPYTSSGASMQCLDGAEAPGLGVTRESVK